MTEEENKFLKDQLESCQMLCTTAVDRSNPLIITPLILS